MSKQIKITESFLFLRLPYHADYVYPTLPHKLDVTQGILLFLRLPYHADYAYPTPPHKLDVTQGQFLSRV